MQDAAVAQVNGVHGGHARGPGRRRRPTAHVRVSLTSVDPKDGAILALYGGPDYLTDAENRATYDKIQPGSTFKPFTLIAALEQGVPLTTKFNGRSPQDIPAGTW